jgi:hypothetical protein
VIHPYLIVKKEEARVALDMADKFGLGKRGGYTFSEEESRELFACSLKLKALKRINYGREKLIYENS